MMGAPAAREAAALWRYRAFMKLSVIMPVYNEATTIGEVVRRVREAAPDAELIVVDDGSTDGTRAALEALDGAPGLQVFRHERNRGKGAAIRTALEAVQGDVVVIQDADLEYDPREYVRLVQPIVEGHADVVFGSRFVGHGPHRVVYFWHYVGNRLLTLLSNCFTNLNLTDMETGHKAFRRQVLRAMPLRENGFGFEPEVTARAAAMRCRVYEVGVSYYGRTYEEGKKIGWRDGLRTLWCIVKYSTWGRRGR